MERRKAQAHNFAKWYNKTKIQEQEIEQQKLRVQSLEECVRRLEDGLNTAKTLALSLQDSACQDEVHLRLIKTLTETVNLIPHPQSPDQESITIEPRSSINVCPEEDESGHCNKKLATNDDSNKTIEDSSSNVEVPEKFVLNLSVEEKVFSNHLLAYKIFTHVPAEDLIKFRKVNRAFNDNATRVLREKKCLAYFYLIGGERRIKDFNNLVETSSSLNLPLPFTGTSISVSKPNTKPEEVPIECYGMNKHLAVDLGHIPFHDQENAIKFLQHTFRCSAPHLTELSLGSLPNQITRFYHLFSLDGSAPPESRQLPQLTRLILPKRQTTIPPKILKDILKSAPKLIEFEGEVTPSQVKPFVALKKAQMIKGFRLECTGVIDFHIASKFARTRPKLTRLIFPKFPPSADGGAIFLYRNIFKVLCECSQDSLDLLEVPHLTFLKYSGREPVFKNLKRLNLKYDINCGRTLNELALTKLNFSHTFPALNFVIIQLDSLLFRYSENLLLGPEFREPGQINQCWTVKKLKLKGKQMNPTLIYQMAIIFPNVVELQLSKARDYKDVFNALWGSWTTTLRSLRVDLRDTYFTESLDSTFTGLPSEKCQELYAARNYKDAETLALHRASSIMSLKKLRKLQLLIIQASPSTLRNNEEDNEPAVQKMPFEPFFTKVTCKYAFDQLPKLKVKLAFNNNCKHPDGMNEDD